MRWRFHPIHTKLFLFSKAFQSLLTVITLPESQLGIEKSLRNHYTITIDCMAVRHCCSLRRDAFRLNVLGDDVVNESRRIGQVAIQLMYATTTRLVESVFWPDCQRPISCDSTAQRFRCTATVPRALLRRGVTVKERWILDSVVNLGTFLWQPRRQDCQVEVCGHQSP